MFLDQYDYNKKATLPYAKCAYQTFIDVIKSLLICKFKQPSEYQRVSDIPEEEKLLLIKCLGHNIGVWNMHILYIAFVNNKI